MNSKGGRGGGAGDRLAYGAAVGHADGHDGVGGEVGGGAGRLIRKSREDVQVDQVGSHQLAAPVARSPDRGRKGRGIGGLREHHGTHAGPLWCIHRAR